MEKIFEYINLLEKRLNEYSDKEYKKLDTSENMFCHTELEERIEQLKND